MDNSEWMTAILKAIIIQGSMVVVYVSILKSNFSHILKRGFLLASLILPLVAAFPFSANVNTPIYVYSSRLPEISITLLQEEKVQNSISSLLTENFTLIVYLTGLLLLTIFFFYRLIRTIKLTRRATPVLFNDIRIYSLSDFSDPFSFFQRVYIPHHLLSKKEELIPVLLHEQAHKNQFHVLDQILSEIMVILFWFNPILWYIKKEIILNHEYLADQSVIKKGIVLRTYQMALLENTISKKYSFTLSFKSHLKERIIMLNRKKLSTYGQVFLLGLAILVLTSSAIISSRVVIKPSFDSNRQLQDQKQVESELIKFPGGQSALFEFIRKNVKYPEQARLKGVEGTVMVELTFNSKGKIIARKILRAVDPELEKEALRVIDLMPDWILVGTSTSQQAVTYVLPIRFVLGDDHSSLKGKDGQNFIAPERNAEYPGGIDALKSFITANLEYPRQARQEKREGTVYVQFEVSETGRIANIKVLRGVCKELDEAAINIIKKMPDWKPAKQDGKSITSIYTLPIKYKLDSNDTK